MAVLGVQLVLSMVMASFLQKLSQYFSVGRWLLCRRLVRYLHPTNNDLKSFTGTGKGKHRKEFRNLAASESFTVPKNIALQLETAKVEIVDVMQLHYYTEYQWLVDFSVCSLLVFLITDVYYTIFPHLQEINLANFWCILVIIFAMKILVSLTAGYFRTSDTGERSMCLTFSLFSLVLSMVVLIVDEEHLEFGLDGAYTEFNKTAGAFLENQGILSSGPASKFTVKLVLVILSAFIGGLLTFPGLRFAKMYIDALKYSSESPSHRALLHINFISPLLIILMWIKPVARDAVVNEGFSDASFESLRMWSIVIVISLRFILLRSHLQAYLNLAYQRIEDMKKEHGRISNDDIQKKVARIFYYLCVVALQYLAPLLFLLFSVFLMKSLGDLRWFGDWYTSDVIIIPPEPKQEIVQAQLASIGLESLKEVFTAIVLRGLISYVIWWTSLTLFLSSLLGLAFWTMTTPA